jgi:hypothetical protein
MGVLEYSFSLFCVSYIHRGCKISACSVDIRPGNLVPKSLNIYGRENWSRLVNNSQIGNTPLHEAILHRYIAIAATLIQRGADINAINSLGGTPLHISSKLGSGSIVRSLLAEVQEFTPTLHVAVSSERHETVAYLLS